MTFLLNLCNPSRGNVIAQPASGLVTEPVSVVPNLSAFNMFMHAELTAQIVMLLLIAASIWSWAIAFEKHFYSEI